MGTENPSSVEQLREKYGLPKKDGEHVPTMDELWEDFHKMYTMPLENQAESLYSEAVNAHHRCDYRTSTYCLLEAIYLQNRAILNRLKTN